MFAIISAYQKGGTMIQKTSGRQKILEIIFFVFCLLTVGVGVGRGADVNWSAEEVDGTSSLLPGTAEQLILKLKATNTSGDTDYNVNAITVTSTGNPLKIEDVISNTVKLWKDIDGVWENGSGEVCIKISTFSSDTPSKVVFSSLADSVPAGLSRYFYITYDLKTSVTDRHTIDVDVESISDINMSGGTVVFPDGAPLNSSGSPSYDTIEVTAVDYTVDLLFDQIAGKPVGVKIQMVDGDGNLDLDYSDGTISVTGADVDFPTSAPDGTSPSYPPAESWQGLSDGGEKILTVVLYNKEENRKLKVTDSVFGPTDSNFFNIDAGIKFNLSLPQNIQVKKSADIRIYIYEPYQNDFTYTGTAEFTSTDSQATLPDNYTFSAGETGKIFSNGITFETVDCHTVTLMDTIVSNISGTQTVIVQSENEGYRSMNYPNPFDSHQGTTTIQFYMNGEGKAEIKIYTLTGNLVNEWDVEAQAGINTAFQWDGRDKDGNMVANGTYLCRIKTDIKKETIKISIIK